MSLSRSQVMAFAKKLREIEAEIKRVCASSDHARWYRNWLTAVNEDAPSKPRPRAADDFDAIRAKVAEMKRERMVCKVCGKRHGEIHTPECGFSGTVVEAECQ